VIELNKELHDLKKSLDWFLLPMHCKVLPEGKSEIYDFDVQASYSPYNTVASQTFGHSSTPTDQSISHSERLPDVPEIKRSQLLRELGSRTGVPSQLEAI